MNKTNSANKLGDLTQKQAALVKDILESVHLNLVDRINHCEFKTDASDANARTRENELSAIIELL